MRLAIGVVVAFGGPVVLGWMLIRLLWPECPSGLRLSIGALLGMGLTGALYYLALVVTRSSTVSFIASELSLAILLVFSFPLLCQGGESESVAFFST